MTLTVCLNTYKEDQKGSKPTSKEIKQRTFIWTKLTNKRPTRTRRVVGVVGVLVDAQEDIRMGILDEVGSRLLHRLLDECSLIVQTNRAIVLGPLS